MLFTFLTVSSRCFCTPLYRRGGHEFREPSSGRQRRPAGRQPVQKKKTNAKGYKRKVSVPAAKINTNTSFRAILLVAGAPGPPPLLLQSQHALQQSAAAQEVCGYRGEGAKGEAAQVARVADHDAAIPLQPASHPAAALPCAQRQTQNGDARHERKVCPVFHRNIQVRCSP